MPDQSQSITSKTAKPKKTNLFIIYILIAIIVIAGAIAVYYFFFAKEKTNSNANQVVVNTNTTVNENENQNTNQVIVVNENVNSSSNVNINANANTNKTVVINSNTNVDLNTNTSIDETAGWQTYNNSTYKYQIKYPDSWFTKSCSTAYTAFASEEKRLPPCETEASADVQISVNIDTPASYYQEDITQTKAYLNVTSETDITVSGITAKRLAGTTKAMEGPGPAEGTEEIYVVFMTNNILYHLVYYKNTDHDYSSIFDQMVSTFDFVD